METPDSTDYLQWTRLKQARFFRKLANSGMTLHDYSLSLHSARCNPPHEPATNPSSDNSRGLKGSAEALEKWVPISSRQDGVKRATSVCGVRFNEHLARTASRLDTVHEYIIGNNVRRDAGGKKLEAPVQARVSRNSESIPAQRSLNCSKTFNIALAENNPANSERKPCNKQSHIKESVGDVMRSGRLKGSVKRRQGKSVKKRVCMTPNKTHVNNRFKKNTVNNKSIVLVNLQTLKNPGKDAKSEKESNSQKAHQTVTKIFTIKTVSPLKTAKQEQPSKPKPSLNAVKKQKTNKAAELLRKSKK